jgi:hypothetical protein
MHFMETKAALECTHGPATAPYSVPTNAVLTIFITTYLFYVHSNITVSSRWVGGAAYAISSPIHYYLRCTHSL